MKTTQDIVSVMKQSLVEAFNLKSDKELFFLGKCFLVLKRGSFEITHPKDEYIEVTCHDYFGGKHSHDLMKEKKRMCFIDANSFVLKAGSQGCTFDLYYPPLLEKKD